MGVNSIWSLMRYLFPQTIIKNCSTVHSAAEKAVSSSRTPYSPNVHALVDINFLLHRAARGVEDASSGAKMMAHSVRQGLDDAVREAITSRKNPRQNPMNVISVFAAVDGPPPLSKLLMQREQRMAAPKNRGTPTSAARFSSLNFTPGSLFMMTLDAVVADHICWIVGRNSAPRDCIYSGSRVPGQGEIKIVEHLLHHASRPWNMGDLFLILTGNSDVIIHLLLAPSEIRTGLLDLNERVAFFPWKMEEHLAPLFRKHVASMDLHRVQQDLALLFILAYGTDLLPSLEKTSFNALWIGYQDIINSMAQTDDTPVLYLLDVSASKLNFKTFARVLEKAEQLVTDGIVYSSGRVSDAYLNTPEAEEHSSHVDVPVHEEPLESDTTSIEDVLQKQIEELNPTNPNVSRLISRHIENASLYVDTLMWTLLSRTRGLTRDYRLMYDNDHGLDLVTLRKWIFAQLEGKQAVFWDGPEAVTPPEKSQVVHPSFSKYIPEFTDVLQTKQQEAANAVATFPHDYITCSAKQRSLIPNRKEMFLASIQFFESLSLKLYQPALNFATPCRARIVESVKEVLTEKQAKTSIDACMLPVAPPSKMDTRLNGCSYVVFAGPGKKGVCFEMMDVKTGKWVWVRDLDNRISEAKNAYSDCDQM
ncbi:hypothetical protein CcCBS67573_g06268 [Chytriomyces confervae]|uniref:Xrn1 N-terminal domain-containing protein n=1 Tax=Chytriomyces confervae TaxID=246404 RepID=A0A507F4U3_9FUNG|nr:hypothetical protein HDU80_009891 [Chytriomyces hyalinus]TPX71273.1 hypothetical protein CcCBS67573_g06268 [Chytriomyces confervae]